MNCCLCGKARYPDKMAKLRIWVPDAKEKNYIATMPWCWGCDNVGKNAKPEIVAGRKQAYVAFLMQDWDGETMRECTECKASFPDVLFPYTNGYSGQRIVRRKRCMECRANKAFDAVAKRHVIIPDNAFDVATQWVEQQTGRKFSAWTRRDHNAHCLLMRELVGLPHHTQRIGTHVSPPTPQQEAIWRQRVQEAITTYLPTANDWRRWHVGSALSSNA